MPREIYMNIPAQNPRNAPSFEELRIQDYLHAYRTTGKPPLPCPPQPTNQAHRDALRLPPLIEPYTEIVQGTTDSVMNNGVSSLFAVVNGVIPRALPDVHIFRPEPVTGEVRGALFQTIVCQQEFLGWSSEELRVSAYAKGRKYAPEAAPQPVPQPTPVMPGYTSENFQCITCQPDYVRHSVEELRVAFNRTGRQLTSAEILQRSAALRIAAP